MLNLFKITIFLRNSSPRNKNLYKNQTSYIYFSQKMRARDIATKRDNTNVIVDLKSRNILFK